MEREYILPNKHDRDTAPFFAAADRGELVYQVCDECSRSIHPPRARCAACGSWNTSWKRASGRGRLHSWTTVAHQVHPAFPAPYTVFVVELEDDPTVRLVGYMAGEPEVAEGMSMRVRFEALPDGTVLPQWEPEA